MSRTTLASAVIVFFTAAACAVESPTEWRILNAPLASADAVEFSFVAVQAGPHQVIIEFPWPIADQQTETVMSAAVSTIGETEAPRFDISWLLLRDGVAVAERRSPQQATGVVDTHTSGLGSGLLTSRGLVLGGCELAASARYTLRVVPGPPFAPMAKSNPSIVVAFQPFTIAAP